MADPFHAELLLLGAGDHLDGRLDEQVILVMNPPVLGQVVGEVQTDFRRGAVGFDRNTLDLEGVGVGQFLITLGDARIVFQFQSLAEGGHGLFGRPALIVQFTQPEQGAGAFERRARRLKGVPGRLSGAFPRLLLSLRVFGALRQSAPCLTQIQPDHRWRAGGQGGFVALDGGGQIVLPSQLLGLLRQRGGWLTCGIAVVANGLQILGGGHRQCRIVEGVGTDRQQ